MLRRLRTASCTTEDIAVLESRVISPDSPDYSNQALHVYRVNEDVDQHNEHMLSKLTSVTRMYEIKASDAITCLTKHIDLASLSIVHQDINFQNLIAYIFFCKKKNLATIYFLNHFNLIYCFLEKLGK